MTTIQEANIAFALSRMAQSNPAGACVVQQETTRSGARLEYRVVTYDRLEQWSNALAGGLRYYDVVAGTRVAIMVPPGPELFALVFSLFKLGAVPVLIDPGIGLKHMKNCLNEARPDVFIGVPKALFARKIFRWAGATIKHIIAAGARWSFGHKTLADIAAQGADAENTFQPAEVGPDDKAAILFTSGSTGPPKGVVYTHGIFQDQIQCLRELYDIQPGERDISTFPLFALFGPALGMTSIIPAMDSTKPAEVVPGRIIAAVNDWRATNLFGSPALLETVGRGGDAVAASLPSLRRVLSSGAPARPSTLERFAKMLTDGAQIHTPYGATESLPVASIGSEDILGETAALTAQGRGVCVGFPAPRVEVRIIKISDEPVSQWSDDLELPEGDVGEIIVRGPRTTREYFARPEATALAKIDDGQGGVYHRMGDLGYFDASGRLWFCGRKSHRVITDDGTLFTVVCERIFDEHPDVFRTALVGVGKSGSQRPVLCVELASDKNFNSSQKEKIIADLRQTGAKYRQTQSIQDFLIHESFPVDIRHNAKIFREKLKLWAEKEI